MPEPAGGWMREAFAFLPRIRVASGFVIGAIVFWLASPTRDTLIAGAAIAAVGEAIRFWAAGHLQKAREVTASGPYRWFAHPLYVGSAVMGAGLAVASRSLVVTAIVALYVGVALSVAAKHEEGVLRGKFGDAYDRYRRGTTTGGGEVPSRRFSFERALVNREHRAVAGLLLAVLLLALKAAYHV